MITSFFKYRLNIPLLIFTICLLSFHPALSWEIVLISLAFSCLGAFIYIFNKATDQVEDAINVSGLPVEVQYYRKIMMGAFICLIVPIAFLIQWPSLLGLYLIMAVIGYFYSRPMVIAKFKARFKDFFFIKNFISAICWATGPAFLPVLYYNQDLTFYTLFTWLNYFVFIFAVEVMWDIRDIEGDRIAGIKTLPNTFGVWPAKIICLVPVIVLFGTRLTLVYIHPIYITAYVLTIISILITKKTSHPLMFQAMTLIWIAANTLFLGQYYLK